MKHPKQFDEYSEAEVARKLADLNYETLANILMKLNWELYQDSLKDKEKGRKILADHLENCADQLDTCSNTLFMIADLCEGLE